MVIQSSKDRVYAFDVKILPDDKILLTGRVPASTSTDNMFVAKYSSNGILDTTFGINGYCWFSAISQYTKTNLYLYPNGRFLVYGGLSKDHSSSIRPSIICYHANGIIDSSFADNGRYTGADFPFSGYFSRLTVQKDSSIVALGTVRKKQSSSIYMPTITYITSSGKNIEILGDKGTVVVGNGLDTGGMNNAIFYGNDRCIFNCPAYDIPNSQVKILCSYLDGVIDSTFGTNGKIEMQFSDGEEEFDDIIESDKRKLVCSGNLYGSNTKRGILTRFLPTGAIDLSFGEFGVAPEPNDEFLYSLDLIALDSNMKILHAGYKYDSLNVLSSAMLCYNSDGTIDSSWGKNGKNIDLLKYKIDINSVAVQRDGKLLVYGDGWNDTGRTSILFRINGSDKSRVQFKTLASLVSISLHPTPSTDKCTVTYTLPSSGESTMTLRDESGREVKTFMTGEYRTAGKHEDELDLRGLASGVYFLSLEHNGNIETAKVVVSR